jgi:chemotaxis regulatin CheY-phosphate phosphatase CheZ
LDAADRDAYVAELLERTRRALQESLDAINAECGPEVAALSHSNPFLVRRRASRA